ncbi:MULTISPECIES: DUF3014 domain-containing protein [unclassified Variovorax]|uniref:DUF3014 domain-containing protein n=1 Tax=unclassified Variovorax TaxID=663243 RepID=UPI003F449CE1
MPDRDDRDAPDFRPRREMPTGAIVVAVLVLLAAAFFGWRWFQQQQQTLKEPVPVAAAPNDAPAVPPPPAAAEPTGPKNPVDALAPADAALPKLADSDSRVMKALAGLLGAKNAEAFLRSDGIVNRFVATVDNLAREQAPANAWPVQPTGQRFITEGEGEAQAISANNAARYNGVVLLAQSIDPAKAAAVYARLYPLFQQAYEELGYPGRYFNDRLVAVIDHLLQAPEPTGPVLVRLVEVKGDVPSQRPWVRYEYVDPQLQSLSSGQKIMVRMGPENERKVKASLRGLRQQIATGEVANAANGANAAKKKQP